MGLRERGRTRKQETKTCSKLTKVILTEQELSECNRSCRKSQVSASQGGRVDREGAVRRDSEVSAEGGGADETQSSGPGCEEADFHVGVDHSLARKDTSW